MACEETFATADMKFRQFIMEQRDAEHRDAYHREKIWQIYFRWGSGSDVIWRWK